MARNLRALLGLGAASAISAVLTIAYVALSGRRLGPAQYSNFAAAMSIIQVCALIAGPFGSTAARLVARYRARGEQQNVVGFRRVIFRGIARAWLPFAAASIIVSVALTPLLHFRTVLIPLLAFVATAAIAILSIDRGILQGIGALHRQNANLLLEPGLRMVAALLFLEVSHSATATLLAYALAPVVAELHLALTIGRDWRDSEAADVEIGEINRTLLPLALMMGAFAVFQNIDVLAAKRFLSSSDAGLYGAAASLTRGFTAIFFPVYVIAGPMLTELHEAGRPLTAATLRLCGWFGALSAVPLALFVCVPRPFVVLLFGAAYEGAAPYVTAIAPLAVLTLLSLMLAQGVVTLASRAHTRVWIAFVVLQLAMLALLHRDAMQIIVAMYAVQVPLFVATALLLVHADRKRS